MTTKINLSDIKDTFGSGAANVPPLGAGTPSIRDVLRQILSTEGGTFADAAALTASLAANRVNGQFGVTLDTYTLWVWEAASTATADSTHVIPTDSAAAGRWVAMSQTVDPPVVGDASGTCSAIVVNKLKGATVPASPVVGDAAKPLVVGHSGGAYVIGAAIPAIASTAAVALGVAAIAGALGTVSDAGHIHAWAQKKTVTITEADLTDAVNGEAQVVNIGTVLPAKALVLGCCVTLTTQFTGGSASTVVMDVGGTDPDAIVAAMDVKGSTAGGAVYDAGASAAAKPRGLYGAQQLTATFTPDGSHTLLALSAGSVTIDVFYVAAF